MKIESHLYPGDTYKYISDESGSDSDGAESTSSSYSSLSDFVTDMVNSEIDGDTPCKYIEGLYNLKNVICCCLNDCLMVRKFNKLLCSIYLCLRII